MQGKCEGHMFTGEIPLATHLSMPAMNLKYCLKVCEWCAKTRAKWFSDPYAQLDEYQKVKKMLKKISKA